MCQFSKLSRQIYPECWSHPIRYSHVSGWTPPLSMTLAKIVTEDSAFWDKPRLGLRESLHQFSEITSTKKTEMGPKTNGPTKKLFNHPGCWLYHVTSPSLCREMLGFPHLFWGARHAKPAPPPAVRPVAAAFRRVDPGPRIHCWGPLKSWIHMAIYGNIWLIYYG